MNRSLFAGLLALAAAPFASASVVYSGLQNISVPFDLGGVYFNVVTGATSASQPADWQTAPWVNLFFGGVGIASDELFRPVVASGGRVLNLAFGDTIDGSDTFAATPNGSSTHIGPAADQFQLLTSGYLGFSFRPTTVVSSATPNFGWMRVTLNNGSGAFIHEWGYDDVANTPIEVGAVPEPASTAALVGLLGLGFAGLRRRRAA